MFRRASALLIFLVTVSSLVACGSAMPIPTPTTISNPAFDVTNNSESAKPPTYIKDVVAYKDGDTAFTIYFTLADKYGALTSADGTVDLLIAENLQDRSINYPEAQLYHRTYRVHTSDFSVATVGTGAFSQQSLLLRVGRLVYGSFDKPPEVGGGKIRVRFTTMDGQTFEGTTDVSFDH